MSRVAIITDRAAVLESCVPSLQAAGWEPVSLQPGRPMASPIRTSSAVLIDLTASDAGEVSQVKSVSPGTPVVIIAAPCASALIVEAVRRGADDFVSWPLRAERLLGVLERLTGVDRVACPWHVDHASARWASIVAPLVKAPMDPRTLQLWSRWVAASPGTIRGWCGTAGISTKASLDLGRMLRVVATGRGDRRSLTDLLDIVDKRTLAVMLRLGAPASTVPAPLPRTIDELLARQQWVRKSAAVDALRSRLETQRCLSSGGEPRERQLASVRGYTVRAEVDWAHEPGNRRRTPRGLTA